MDEAPSSARWTREAGSSTRFSLPSTTQLGRRRRRYRPHRLTAADGLHAGGFVYPLDFDVPSECLLEGVGSDMT